MKFLETSATEAAIKELLAGSGPSKIAVAYWGLDAVERLGISSDHDLTIVCDLLSGGCNPKEIRKLREILGVDRVLTQDRLHAKAWIAENLAIVGSSNASGNGLGFESTEAASLIEANLVIQDRQTITELNR